MNVDQKTGNEQQGRAKRSDKSGKSNEGLSNYVFGKVQPQALPLEEAVLGALMLDRDALPVVMDILSPGSFYLEAHQHIYRSIIRLFERSDPVDILTVTEELRKTGELEKVGGAYYLVELSNRVASAANIEYHARIIAQKHIQRELIRVSTRTIRDAYDDTIDVFNLLDDAEKGLFDITQNNLSRTFASMADLSTKVLKQMEELTQKDQDGLTGVPTGFTNLDKLTSGWQPSDLAIIAARPGMGKTSFVLAMALNAAKDFNKGVAIFSLEMASTQLVQRLISMESEIPGSKMRSGKLEDYEWKMLQTTVERLNSAPIFIDDTAGINIFELRAKCRRLKMQHDIQLVIIDYLQLMSGVSENNRNTNREQEIAGISRALKSLAKEISVPVIALSQLSRAVEVRGGSKRPQLSDLRESGCLTGDTLIQDAITGRRIPIKTLAEQQKVKFCALALNEQTLQIQPYAVSRAFYSGKKHVYELTTASGRRIKASGNHPFYSIEGWKPLEELKTGEKIGLARQVHVERPAESMNDDELVLLAHLIGDGCILPRQPYHYTSADPANIRIVAEKASRLFGIKPKVVSQKSWAHVYLPSPYHLTHGVKHPISKWFDALGLTRVRAAEKKLPEQLFSCSNTQIARFLHHLWATDGNLSWIKSRSKKVPAIYYGTTSETLATQVQHLLLRFGIWSTIRMSRKGNYKPSYNVWIQGKASQVAFLKHIGCYGQRGHDVPSMLDVLEATDANPNTDVIPKEAWQLHVKPGKEAAQLSWRELSAAIKTSYSGSALFRSGISRKRMKSVANATQCERLFQLADSDIYWDEIVSVEPLGVQDVYDLTVPFAHNFLANDFIVHNSIEQDADIVSFIYRPEYYGIMEDETGQSLKGIAEIIIAKHRHGALDTIQLKFIDQFAKFANLDDPTFATGAESGFNPSSVIARPSKMNEEDIPF